MWESIILNQGTKCFTASNVNKLLILLSAEVGCGYITSDKFSFSIELGYFIIYLISPKYTLLKKIIFLFSMEDWNTDLQINTLH